MHSDEYEDELGLNDYLAIVMAVVALACRPFDHQHRGCRRLHLYPTGNSRCHGVGSSCSSAAQEATIGFSQNTTYRLRELTNEVNFAYSDAVVAVTRPSSSYVPSVATPCRHFHRPPTR
ncbi:MAG: hypothetical protein R2706_07655 [Acidimicrobiales bacterium]